MSELRLGDTREIIKEYSDEFFDCVVSDIPYKIATGGSRIEFKGNEMSGIMRKVCPNDRLKNRWIKQEDSDTDILVRTGKLFANNEITFDEYFNLDVSTVPIYLKHIYGGIISQYFYACFPHSKLVRMFFNTPDDCFLEFFNLSKNEFIDLNIMNKRDNILKYQSIKNISDKFQEKFGK